MAETAPSICPSCGAERLHRFCPQCGEQRLGPEDASLWRYLGDAWENLAQFDSKFLRSLRGLVNPGRITQDYLAGRRVKLLKPLQLFLLINVVYFFALERSDIFFNHWRYAKDRSSLGMSLRELGESKMQRLGVTEESFRKQHDQLAQQWSKALIVALIPLVALGSWVLFGRSRRYYTEHLTFSAHYLGFMLLWMMVWILMLKYAFKIYRGAWVWEPIAYGLLAWMIIGTKRVFAEPWWKSVPKSFGLFLLGQSLLFDFYRDLVSVVAIIFMD